MEKSDGAPAVGTEEGKNAARVWLGPGRTSEAGEERTRDHPLLICIYPIIADWSLEFSYIDTNHP